MPLFIFSCSNSYNLTQTAKTDIIRTVNSYIEREVMSKYKAVIFDMDGTILDTVSDLQSAVNYALEKCGHRHDFSYDDTKLLFGSGVNVALRRALALENGAPLSAMEKIGAGSDGSEFGVKDDEILKIQQIYLPYYAENCLVKTGPYAGIPDILAKLRALGIKTAVVSNKPDEAVQSLVKDLFNGLFDYSAGEKAGIKRKPAPDMTEAALEFFSITKKDAVYIGDSEIDLQTAANSGLECIAVDWGFRGRDFLCEHDAKEIVSTADELLTAIISE